MNRILEALGTFLFMMDVLQHVYSEVKLLWGAIKDEIAAKP